MERYTYDYPRPAVTSDIAVLRLEELPEILLIQRKAYPFKDMWALPGGFMEMEESLEEAVHREVYEESGIEGLRIIKELGKTQWGDEEQHFFLAEAPSGVMDVFEHWVTGEGIDKEFWYEYKWLEIKGDLGERLVQGCNQFAGELAAAAGVGDQ